MKTPRGGTAEPIPPPEERVIEGTLSRKQFWGDFWRQKELLFFLAWREILIRYKQTYIGLAWSVFRPVMLALCFVLVFGKFARLPSDGVPYILLVYTGLLPWQFFATALSESSGSLIANANLLTKVYFPRLILPVSSILGVVPDLLISVAILVALLVWHKMAWHLNFLLVPVLLILVTALSAGVGIWLSILNVRYRDFRLLLPIILQLGLYISPVGFSGSIVPERWRIFYALNPMVGVIEGIRWCLFGNAFPFPAGALSCSFTITSLLLGSAFWYFPWAEKTMADEV